MAASRWRRALIWSALVLTASALAACSTLGYYWQAVGGQAELRSKARPIDQVLEDATTPAPLRSRLQRVQQIRAFASDALALPRNGSYQRYADIKRPYVVWNVFATPEFSVTPRTWCFPIAGCVAYRGYFAQADAQSFAEKLKSAGYDVYVGGVPAYSTLGWMDDPVLNTFIDYPDTELARLMFHELAHQVVYVSGDSTFNESFAVAVEREGVRRWIVQHGAPDQQSMLERVDARKHAFGELVTHTRAQLGELYASGQPPERMRAMKLQTIETMRAEYQSLKAQWGGYGGYDWWFAQPVNNAQLASVAIYSQLVPGFQALLAREGGDLPRFYSAVRELAQQSKAKRRAALGVVDSGAQEPGG